MKEKAKYPYTEIIGTPLAFYTFAKVTLIIGLFIRIITLLSSFISFQSDFEHWYNLIFGLIQLGLCLGGIIGLNAMEWYGPLCYMGAFAILIVDALVGLGIITYYGLTMDSGTYVGRILGALIWLIPVSIYFRKRRLLFSPPPTDDPRPSKSVSQPVSPLELVVEATMPADTYAPAIEPAVPIAIPAEPVASAPVSASTELVITAPAPAEDVMSSPTPSQDSVPIDVGSEVPATHPPVLFCRKCGGRLISGSAFCSYCGASVDAEV